MTPRTMSALPRRSLRLGSSNQGCPRAILSPLQARAASAGILRRTPRLANLPAPAKRWSSSRSARVRPPRSDQPRRCRPPLGLRLRTPRMVSRLRKRSLSNYKNCVSSDREHRSRTVNARLNPPAEAQGWCAESTDFQWYAAATRQRDGLVPAGYACGRSETSPCRASTPAGHRMPATLGRHRSAGSTNSSKTPSPVHLASGMCAAVLSGPLYSGRAA